MFMQFISGILAVEIFWDDLAVAICRVSRTECRYPAEPTLDDCFDNTKSNQSASDLKDSDRAFTGHPKCY